MKKFLIVVATIIYSITGFAQTNETKVSGSIVDARKMPVESATVSLLKTKDSSIAKIAVSDKAGKFSFPGISYGNYFVTVSSVNYYTAKSSGFFVSVNNAAVILDTLVLQDMSKDLSTVVVTSRKPLLEQKIDRMVVNVDASVTNVGSTALEVLEKSPGVTVDKDGNISLKGKPNVAIMIDGKPSYLTGAELANLLSSMNSNQLSQIEIMTNPSSKYDAAGNAGVINIKTKKSIAQGFNGSVTLNYGQGVYPKTNNSIMLNYRTGKFNAFMNYNYTLNKGFINVDVWRNFLDSAGKKSYELHQFTRVINQSQNNSLKLGLDYFINSKTTIGFVTTGFISPQNSTANTTSYIKDAVGNVTSIEKTTRAVDNTWKNGTLNVNFNTILDKDKNGLSGNFDYMHYNFSGNQDIAGSTYDPNGHLQSTSFLTNYLPLNIDVYSARLDYTKSLGNGWKMESGLKSSLVKTNNSSLYYTSVDDVPKLQDSLSNQFNYSENINAAYVNISARIGDWTVQGGLRAENTNYSGHQNSFTHQQDSSFSRNYTDLFPTAFIGYQLNENNQLALSAGRRIDRPVYRQLNPFVSIIDRYMRMAGNPYLQPQVSNNIELSHTYKNMFTTTLNYGIINDMINETMVHIDSVIIRSIGNIGTRYNFGISESATIPFTRWYTGFFYANLFKNIYKGVVNGYPLNASQITLELNINNQFNFSKGWSGELSGTYSTRNRDEGQAVTLPFGQVSAGLSKQLFDNKASLKLNVRDIFYTQTPKEIQNFQDVQSTLQRSMDTRVVNIAFVYRFGTQSKQKINQQTEEQKRIQAN